MLKSNLSPVPNLCSKRITAFVKEPCFGWLLFGIRADGQILLPCDNQNQMVSVTLHEVEHFVSNLGVHIHIKPLDQNKLSVLSQLRVLPCENSRSPLVFIC